MIKEIRGGDEDSTVRYSQLLEPVVDRLDLYSRLYR